MNVNLTPDLEQLVQSKVKSGRYNSPGEVLREALLLLEQRDEVFGISKDEIHRQIEEGWCSAKGGDSLTATTSLTAWMPNWKGWSAPYRDEAVRPHQARRTRVGTNQEFSC